MLRGRPIGLKASMSVEEMRNHLLSKLKEWTVEGYSEEEVKSAIYSKCKPLGLVSNFYWNRYPDAAERLREAWRSLGWDVGEVITNLVPKDKPFSKSEGGLKKAESKKKEAQLTLDLKKIENYLAQF